MSEPRNNRTHEPSLRELTTQLDDLKELTGERDRSLRDLINERDRLYATQFKSAKEEVASALISAKEAVTKAEAAVEKRFDNTNEWREAMQDRDRNQMPRSEIEQRFDALSDKRLQTIGIIISIFLGLMAVAVAFWKH